MRYFRRRVCPDDSTGLIRRQRIWLAKIHPWTKKPPRRGVGTDGWSAVGQRLVNGWSTVGQRLVNGWSTCKMEQSERGGIDFRRAKPADPSARARARARARYLKKHAAHFFMRESLEQKIANLLLRCAQWTNLGGGVFQNFGDRVTHTGPRGGASGAPAGHKRGTSGALAGH